MILCHHWLVTCGAVPILSNLSLQKCLYASQACLREIHASILRKHLHRLEHPVAAEQIVESEKEIDDKVEDEMHEDEGLSSFLITQPTLFSKYLSDSLYICSICR